MSCSSMISRFLRANRHLLYGDYDRDFLDCKCKQNNQRACKKFDNSWTAAWAANVRQNSVGKKHHFVPKPILSSVQKQTQTERQSDSEMGKITFTKSQIRIENSTKKSQNSATQTREYAVMRKPASSGIKQTRRMVKATKMLKKIAADHKGRDLPIFMSRVFLAYPGKREGFARTILIDQQ